MITKKEIIDGYSKIANRIFMSEEFYESCIKIAGKIQGNIIDIGCGQGRLLEKVLKKFRVNQAIGIDISPKLCALASARNPQASIFNLDAEEVDNKFSENSFDIVFMTEVLEHLLNPQKVLLKISRILKPGGKLIITVPNSDWFGYKKYKRSREIFQPVDDHFYKVDEVKRLLEQNNFRVEEIHGGDVLFNYSGILKFIDKILLLLFPVLSKRMKRLIILAINKKSK